MFKIFKLTFLLPLNRRRTYKAAKKKSGGKKYGAAMYGPSGLPYTYF